MPPRRKIRWAPRLRPALLKRLYDADARGLRDEDLCEEVGSTLFERCRTFERVRKHQVECPACRTVFPVAASGESPCPAEDCAWNTNDADYRESVRNHYAHTGRAIDAFRSYHRRWPSARSYADRIVLIDTLIHSFHIDERTNTSTKSVASKLLEGNKKEVVAFLDALNALDPADKEAWRRQMSQTIDEPHITKPTP